MRTERVYKIRRAILEVCREYADAPVKLDEVSDHTVARRLAVTREELLEEWNGLLTTGYIATIKDSGGEYVGITATGLRQINNEGDKDIYVWGAQGLRQG